MKRLWVVEPGGRGWGWWRCRWRWGSAGRRGSAPAPPSGCPDIPSRTSTSTWVRVVCCVFIFVQEAVGGRAGYYWQLPWKAMGGSNPPSLQCLSSAELPLCSRLLPLTSYVATLWCCAIFHASKSKCNLNNWSHKKWQKLGGNISSINGVIIHVSWQSSWSTIWCILIRQASSTLNPVMSWPTQTSTLWIPTENESSSKHWRPFASY